MYRPERICSGFAIAFPAREKRCYSERSDIAASIPSMLMHERVQGNLEGRMQGRFSAMTKADHSTTESFWSLSWCRELGFTFSKAIRSSDGKCLSRPFTKTLAALARGLKRNLKPESGSISEAFVGPFTSESDR